MNTGKSDSSLISAPEIVGVAGLRFYQKFISPQLAPEKCNFTPSCSRYAIDSVKKYGAISGTVMAFERLSRDHPWAWSENYKVKDNRLIDLP